MGEEDVEFGRGEILGGPIDGRARVEHHAALRQQQARRLPPVVGMIAGGAEEDRAAWALFYYFLGPNNSVAVLAFDHVSGRLADELAGEVCHDLLDRAAAWPSVPSKGSRDRLVPHRLRDSVVAGQPLRRHRHLRHDVHRLVQHRPSRWCGSSCRGTAVPGPRDTPGRRHRKTRPTPAAAWPASRGPRHAPTREHRPRADLHRVDDQPAAPPRPARIAQRNAAVVQIDRERAVGGVTPASAGAAYFSIDAHIAGSIWICWASGPLGRLNTIGSVASCNCGAKCTSAG